MLYEYDQRVLQHQLMPSPRKQWRGFLGVSRSQESEANAKDEQKARALHNRYFETLQS